jgi:lipopolysaccharide transport system permease protein
VLGLGNPEITNLILTINPLAFVLDGYCQVLMYQGAPDAVHLLLIGTGFGVMLAVMVIIMRRSSQFLAVAILAWCRLRYSLMWFTR